MKLQRTSCAHRGKTFYGEYEIVDGANPVVRVHYNDDSMEAAVGGLLEDVVAHRLLKELVIIDAVRRKAAVWAKNAADAKSLADDHPPIVPPVGLAARTPDAAARKLV